MGHLLVTGASTGIGRAAAIGLADRFDRVTLVGRDPDRHRDTMTAIGAAGSEARLVVAELASLDSVGRAAETITEDIDVVIANAGVAGGRGVTQDGFEQHFGVNHLAHHLLVTELASRIRRRVVVVASNAHFDADGLDFEHLTGRTRSLTGFREYRVSKLANVLFGREMAKRHPFTTVVVHPGVVATDIWRRIPWPVRPLVTRTMIPPEEGAQALVQAVTDPAPRSGGYYSRGRVRDPSDRALDDGLARELWERSQDWVEPFRRSES